MPTSVPSPTFGPNGFVAPTEAAVLAGRQADINAAFGGNLSSQLTTPQGQLASLDSAIIADRNAQTVALLNGIDPAVAAGRMQDSIGRIYYISRIPAQSTVVIATCIGQTDVTIPVGAQAQDAAGNVYICTQAGRIPIGGSIDLPFACQTTGPIACAAGSLNKVYRTIPGWDSVTNTDDGAIGRDVETRADFEFRRAQSVAANANGSPASIQGAVLSVTGVLDALTLDNPLDQANGAGFTASITGTVMTVTAVAYSDPHDGIKIGDMVTGTGVAAGTVIASPGSGSGGTGTYNVNISQTLSSRSLFSSQFGVVMVKNSTYSAVVGGLAQAVGEAIWAKKSGGCNYNGNTTVTVTDTSNGYVPPYPTYNVTFRTPTPTPTLFAVLLKNNTGVPSNANALIQAAIVQSFLGADDGPRARIGSILFASRFYANIAKLGPWVQIYSIKLGIAAATLDYIQFRGDQAPTIDASDISVAFTA